MSTDVSQFLRERPWLRVLLATPFVAWIAYGIIAKNIDPHWGYSDDPASIGTREYDVSDLVGSNHVNATNTKNYSERFRSYLKGYLLARFGDDDIPSFNVREVGNRAVLFCEDTERGQARLADALATLRE